MIKRVADCGFDDDVFVKLAESMKQNEKKLFSVASSESEADKIQKELQMSGHTIEVEQDGERYNIYYYTSEKKASDNIEYTAMQKTAGVYDYDFDDGSIWTLKTIDGEQYLVKNVDEDNEDEVIRVKTASKNHKITVDAVDESIIKILKKNKLVVSSKLVDNIKKDIISKVILNNSVEAKIKDYCTTQVKGE